jgi:hypothetical protein
MSYLFCIKITYLYSIFASFFCFCSLSTFILLFGYVRSFNTIGVSLEKRRYYNTKRQRKSNKQNKTNFLFGFRSLKWHETLKPQPQLDPLFITNIIGALSVIALFPTKGTGVNLSSSWSVLRKPLLNLLFFRSFAFPKRLSISDQFWNIKIFKEHCFFFVLTEIGEC